MSALYDAALSYVGAHLSVIPIKDTRAKQPAVQWGIYQEHCPPPADIAAWWGSNPAIAIVCGAVSRGLTVLDFDAGYRLVYDEFRTLMESTHPGLVDSLPMVTTQRGGKHLYLYADIIEGNQKLATTAPMQLTDDATGERKTRVYSYIETRGHGGYVLTPPTPGYALVRGDLLDYTRVVGLDLFEGDGHGSLLPRRIKGTKESCGRLERSN